MAAEVVRVEGLDQLRRVIRQVADKGVADQLKATNKSAAEVVVKAALPHVPVRTGRLKSSVRALGSQKSGRAQAGGARALYAAPIHWGRKRGGLIVGRPFLWDAAKRHEQQIADQYADDIYAVVQAIERVIG